MSVIHVVDSAGTAHAIDAPEGWRVMEILRDSGLGIEGLCGGLCDCATCHVEIDPAWRGRLAPPREDEEDTLLELPEQSPGSRLSCQIIWSEELDGLRLTIKRG